MGLHFHVLYGWLLLIFMQTSFAMSPDDLPIAGQVYPVLEVESVAVDASAIIEQQAASEKSDEIQMVLGTLLLKILPKTYQDKTNIVDEAVGEIMFPDQDSFIVDDNHRLLYFLYDSMRKSQRLDESSRSRIVQKFHEASIFLEDKN